MDLKRALFVWMGAALLLAWAGATQAQMVTDGLISYWPLDNATIKGDTVEDVWGDNDGILVGNPKSVNGQVGQGLEFDGTNGVEVPGTETLDFKGADQMTVMAWVNTGSDDPVQGVVAGCCGTIVAQRDVNGWALRYDGRNAGAEMEFIVHGGNWIGDNGFGAPLFPAGEWHHLVGIIDGADMFLYADGELVQQGAFGDTVASAGTKLEIGKAGDGGFVGIIDEVAIYNRPLSADEVKANFNAKGLAVWPEGKLATLWGRIKTRR